MSMGNPNFDNLEQTIINLSVRRYQQPLYRWGHWLGWLLPLLLIPSFVPALKSYRNIAGNIGVIGILTGFSSSPRRLIGKLAVAADPTLQPASINEPRIFGRATLITMLVSTLSAIVLSLLTQDNSHGWGFIATFCGFECFINSIGGAILMFSSFIIYFVFRKIALERGAANWTHGASGIAFLVHYAALSST